MTDLAKTIAELEEALKAANLTGNKWTVGYTNIGPDDNTRLIAFLYDGDEEDGPIICVDEEPSDDVLPSPALHLIALMRNALPTLIEAVKRQGEAKDKPIWGVWVDYNLAPPGSYACLVSSFVNGEWSDPEARWMPAQGRPALQGQTRIMPHLMPNDPLTAHKETTDV